MGRHGLGEAIKMGCDRGKSQRKKV